MMKNIIYILTIFASTWFLSCSNDDYINADEKEEIVIEGWIKDGDNPVVIVTTSIPVSTEQQNAEELNNHILNWARVAVSDGEKEVVLTGFYDKRYFPPYIFTTTDIKGEVGKTYTLDVRWEKYHARATTTIPEPVKLEQVTQHPVEGNDSLWNIHAIFNDPPGQQHYCLFYSRGDDAVQLTKADMGLFDDTSLGCSNITFTNVSYPVYRSRTFTDGTNYSEYFVENDTICVELCTLDDTSYNFWYDYQNSMTLANNFFVPYTNNIRYNIRNGKGYWCGYGTSQLWTIVGESRGKTP